jgi:hypothetical protein
VVAFSYPNELGTPVSAKPQKRRVVPRWLREPTVIAAIIGLVGTLLAVIIPALNSARRDRPGLPHPADQIAVPVVTQNEKAAQPHPLDPPKQKIVDRMLTLDQILDVLERHRQRATFGAVAGILGREPISLFNGYVRSPKTAWIVSKSTGLPTGTKEEDYPSGLLEKKSVIDAPEELRKWLQENH